MIGTTLQNRYHLDDEVGCRGIDTVYRAHDTLFDRPVALMVFATLLKSPRSFCSTPAINTTAPESAVRVRANTSGAIPTLTMPTGTSATRKSKSTTVFGVCRLALPLIRRGCLCRPS